jgi:phosphate transport system permease protein
MAAEAESGQPGGSQFETDRHLWVRRLKGWLFEGLLVAATVFGVLALGVLFGLIGLDALGLEAAEPAWYLIYFGTLVAPMSVYTLHVRRHAEVADINARAFLVALGSLAFAVVAYAVPQALDPYDVAVHTFFFLGPPAAVLAYGRFVGENRLTGPAVPVTALAGLLLGFLVFDSVRGVIGDAEGWIAYFLFVTLPVAGVLGTLVWRRWGRRAGLGAAGGVVLTTVLTVAAGTSLGTDPSLSIVLLSGFVSPVILLVADTLDHHPEGRVGLLGPVILIGGILLGAWIESQAGIAGIDTWLNPTLLLESWSDFRPEQAGIYPQLLGSIMIVSLMTLLTFPVGVGAAVYLEEYAPETGWKGALADVLDVNISNLAGVPSVVYGLFGLALARNVFDVTPGILIIASITLGLLVLPIVIVASQEALRSVPDEYRKGSYGLGGSRWQTVRNVVLPEALPGVLTGTILAIGRAIGETAPLVMIALATTRFSPPEGLFSGATALPLQIFAAKGNNIPEYRTGVVAAASIVLLSLMLLMNATAIIVRNRYQK